jgi:energy-converting hydrogenase A subunit I
MKGMPSKTTAFRIWVLCGLAAAGVSLAYLAGLLPLLAAEGVLVLAFPAFILFLFLWWSAPEGLEDIPFMGY